MVKDGWEGMADATDGDYFLDMAESPGQMDISQSVAGIEDGENYTLTFDAGDRTSDLSNSMDVYFGGELIATVDPQQPDAFESFSFDLVGGSGDGTNTIRFVETGTNDNVGISLDNIQLTTAISDTIDGGEGNDTINAGSGDDTIIGGSGNDTINAGDGDDTIDSTEGSDNVDAGSGDDTITVGENFLSGGDIDGGEGEDALVFDGADLDIDLSTLDAGALQNIEHLNIDGSGSNNLRISAEDVLDITDGENKLFIDGDSDDSVEISADYTSQGTESVDGVDYTHYYDAGTDSHLYINNDISDLNTF